MKRPNAPIIAVLLALSALRGSALAQQTSNPSAHAADPPDDHSAEAADVAKQLANPIANLVSIPFQFNWQVHIAPFDSTRFLLNFQPVVPMTLNDNWNLIMALQTSRSRCASRLQSRS